MALAAEVAIRAWINARPIVTGVNLDEDVPPLANGAFLLPQASPADGTYAFLSRNPEGVGSVVAEDSLISTARIQCLVFGGTVEAAERAAAALRGEFEKLTGCPEPCGDTGVIVMTADNHNGPFFIPLQASGSEVFCFQVGADFMLREA